MTVLDGRPTTYSPSPRPTFDEPTLIRYHQATRHIWGDVVAGEVMDWIYVSSGQIHALVFGLPPGGSFRLSDDFRTVFGADEVLHVLSGTMLLSNPETGEVERVPAGESVFFRPNTWHHAFAEGSQALRVLELFAPPPSAGAAGTYARTRPLLDQVLYVQNDLLGHLPDVSKRPRTLMRLRESDLVHRREGSARVSVLVSTDQLTVATLDLSPGAGSGVHAHAGDEVAFVTQGSLVARAWFNGRTYVFEAGPQDVVYIPAECQHEFRNLTGEQSMAIIGVAPTYLASPSGATPRTNE